MKKRPPRQAFPSGTQQRQEGNHGARKKPKSQQIAFTYLTFGWTIFSMTNALIAASDEMLQQPTEADLQTTICPEVRLCEL
jgi:hypothetical protein